jgi:hypothetical protein
MSDTEVEQNEATAQPVQQPSAVAPATPRKRKHRLPDGWIPPVEFRHMLVEEGLAPDTLNSAQIYILSRSAATNGMPVKHFDAAHNQYDTLQVDADGITITRPGIDPEAGREWWQNRPKRQPGGAKKVAETKEEPKEEGASEEPATEQLKEAEAQAAEDELDFDDDEDSSEIEAE